MSYCSRGVDNYEQPTQLSPEQPRLHPTFVSKRTRENPTNSGAGDASGDYDTDLNFLTAIVRVVLSVYLLATTRQSALQDIKLVYFLAFMSSPLDRLSATVACIPLERNTCKDNFAVITCLLCSLCSSLLDKLLLP